MCASSCWWSSSVVFFSIILLLRISFSYGDNCSGNNCTENNNETNAGKRDVEGKKPFFSIPVVV